MSKHTRQGQLLHSDAAPPHNLATQTVELSFRLVERLAASKEALGVSELAREFAVSKATIYRHVQALLATGFADQELSTLKYKAGIKLFILGESLRRNFDLIPVARDEMVRLRDDTGQPVTISSVVNGQVIVLDVLQGASIVNFGTQAGTVLDLHASAHGKIALAFGPLELLDGCCVRKLKAWTSQTICSHPALARAVAEIRSRGWATAPNQVLEGVNGLAAPIFNHTGAYAGAIAIAGSIQFIPASPTRKQVKAVRKLGWAGR
jgi:IclR family transcriptional regulator, acetate operon repressor